MIGDGHHDGHSTTGMSLETSKPVPIHWDETPSQMPLPQVGQGREVFANYGPDCSPHFIMNYGFLPHYCADEMLGLAPNLAP